MSPFFVVIEIINAIAFIYCILELYVFQNLFVPPCGTLGCALKIYMPVVFIYNGFLFWIISKAKGASGQYQVFNIWVWYKYKEALSGLFSPQDYRTYVILAKVAYVLVISFVFIVVVSMYIC